MRTKLDLLCLHSYARINNKARTLKSESQNQSFIQTEQLPDGSNSGITAGFAESALVVDNKNVIINAIYYSLWCNPIILIVK